MKHEGGEEKGQKTLSMNLESEKERVKENEGAQRKNKN